MIQRIQSLYLFLAGVISIASGVYIDIIINESIEEILFLSIGIFAFISILCYKKRKLQKKINYLNIIINVLLISFMVYDLFKTAGGVITPKKVVELLVPLLLIILLAMANKFINKDEKLVKSIDRFR